ncbi:hypothetical protein SAMN05421772_1293 [Paracoccus saliphilus]|uniref:Uncharacterized protein n=1 Tax=Paracoccus saliphilus TaxID=405559 RepID=A0AA46A7Q1_9RHOB|nr:hypothetical protein SAMN05421772_1293 [Paracoccus saliphilus]
MGRRPTQWAWNGAFRLLATYSDTTARLRIAAMGGAGEEADRDDHSDDTREACFEPFPSRPEPDGADRLTNVASATP